MFSDFDFVLKSVDISENKAYNEVVKKMMKLEETHESRRPDRIR
jgi:hypothetical protein